MSLDYIKQITLRTLKNGESVQKTYNLSSGQTIIRLTYDELIDLVNNNGCVGGQLYRITDYTATIGTGYKYAHSVGKKFDIIVTALSGHELSEEAFAVSSDNGDGMTDEKDSLNDSRIRAWKIWYCVSNDISRFGWADTQKGKGVIYRMIDEFGNDAPYDFKGIVFHVATTNGIISSFATSNYKSKFTFDSNEDSNLGVDATLPQSNNDHPAKNNIILPYFDTKGVRQLNKNILMGVNIDGNVLGSNCNEVVLNNSCSGNIIESNCNKITVNSPLTNSTICGNVNNVIITSETTNDNNTVTIHEIKNVKILDRTGKNSNKETISIDEIKDNKMRLIGHDKNGTLYSVVI